MLDCSFPKTGEDTRSGVPRPREATSEQVGCNKELAGCWLDGAMAIWRNKGGLPGNGDVCWVGYLFQAAGLGSRGFVERKSFGLITAGCECKGGRGAKERRDSENRSRERWAWGVDGRCEVRKSTGLPRAVVAHRDGADARSVEGCRRWWEGDGGRVRSAESVVER
jgi:hypothetical protein